LSLGPAKVRVEIFREPGFFDDNFAKGWTKTSGGTSSFSTDGDVATLTKGDQTECIIEKSFPTLSTDIYHKLEIRCTATNAWFYVYVWNGSSWLLIYTGNAVGVFEASIASGYNITKMRIRTTATEAKFDYGAVCKNSLVVPDLGDLVEELTVTRPLLNNGIAGAKFSIPNFAGAYNGLIKNQDAIIIWLARNEANLGVPEYKAFGGRIVNPNKRGEKYGAFYIDLDCHGYAYELNIPPSLLQKFYSGTNGRTIIEDALALCTYLAKHPTATMWFDNAGASGSTDDRINSTHDAIYDEELPAIVIQEILEKTKNPAAVQGFDAYETPAGCIVGHLRNSLDFVSPIASITPNSYQESEDLHRVRNKIKVYGKFGGYIPTTGAWTDSLNYWTARHGTVSWVTPSYIYCDCDASRISEFYRTTNPYDHISGLVNTSPLSVGWIDFYFFHQTCTNPIFQIVIEAPDAANCFYKAYSGYSTNVEIRYTLEFGEGKGWLTLGSPRWENIKNINFYATSSAGIFYVYVRALKLYYSRFKGEANDSPSQTLYGIRTQKPIIDDSLTTDAECQTKAESIVAVLKDPPITLSEVVVDGDHRYNPGDRQRIVVSNDILDAYFRIIQVEHSVKGTQWDAFLTLSNEPQYVDYVFRLLQEAQKLLERRT